MYFIMKKMIIVSGFVVALMSCNNPTTDGDATTDTTRKNMPDTSNVDTRSGQDINQPASDGVQMNDTSGRKDSIPPQR
jgi:hypothetical protein